VINEVRYNLIFSGEKNQNLIRRAIIMRRYRLIRLLAGFCFILISVLLTLAIACANPAPAPASQPVILKAVTFQPGTWTLVNPFWWIVERVKEKSKGELIIQHAGGPDVIAGFNQAMAVKSGAVDMAWVPPAFYPGLVPGAEAIVASTLTCTEERRAGGAYDYLLELHKKAGLYYLGRGQVFSGPTKSFYWFTNKGVKKPQDLAGQRVAFTSPLMVGFATALGASLTIVTPTDLYTSVERGMVDGFIQPLTSTVSPGLHETVKYVINQSFYNSGIGLIMNLDTFNRLPKQLQNTLTDAVKEMELSWGAQSEKEENSDWKTIVARVKVIEFSPADAEWFLKTAYDAQWKDQIKKYPDVSPKLRELMSK
jgi:TRAP-type C4-dicarboxylate transport system substrate-binding protein